RTGRMVVVAENHTVIGGLGEAVAGTLLRAGVAPVFRQIGLPIVAAVAALAGIGLLSQSLDQLEVIVERGQSVWVMVKLTL
ncbi:hypothetical protein ABTO78_21645, partial [Acinetobacter baumannii]